MYFSDGINFKNSYDIINVIRHTLSYIDKRLVDHGERTAYIATQILEHCSFQNSIEKQTLFILCALHDIGAYKTEEIDNMVMFETINVSNHAIYGYLFLKNTKIMGDASEAVLYHHTPYKKLCATETAYKDYAALILLADRVDILLAQNPQTDFSPIQAASGTTFAPKWVDCLFKQDCISAVKRGILSGEYRSNVKELVQSFPFSKDEIFEYLKMLVFAIDFRSPFTVTHTTNTTAISAYLGKKVGLSSADQADLNLGAFLHDIGKIAIPAEILEFPGRLNNEQMKIMRTHVEKTREIIQDVVSQSVCEIAARHHEKLNGRGYPQGLLEQDLTPPQRIIAVADILSALISKRSYKEPFSKEKALAIMEQMVENGDICKSVCDIIFENYDEMMAWVGKKQQEVISLYESTSAEYFRLKDLV